MACGPRMVGPFHYLQKPHSPTAAPTSPSSHLSGLKPKHPGPAAESGPSPVAPRTLSHSGYQLSQGPFRGPEQKLRGKPCWPPPGEPKDPGGAALGEPGVLMPPPPSPNLSLPARGPWTGLAAGKEPQAFRDVPRWQAS